MAWSENSNYKNPDITGLVDNVKRMMGVDSGAAGRRSSTMGNILTGAKTEGQQLKNIGQQNKNVQLKAIADLVKRFMFNPELSDEQQFGRVGSKSSGDLATYLEGEALLGGKKTLQGLDIDKEQTIKKIRDAMAGHQQRDPNSFETGEGRAKGLGDQQRKDDINLDSQARLYKLLTGVGGSPTDALAMTSAGGDQKRRGDAKLKATQVAHEETKNRVAGEIGQKKTDKIDEEIREVSERILNKFSLNETQKMEIRNRVLNDIAKLDQTILTEKKRRALIEEKMKTEAEKLTGEKALTSKRTIESASALKKHWNLAKELYLKAQKQKAEIEKLKTQNQTAEIKLSIAQKTKEYKITKARAESEEAKSKATTAESKQEMTSMDLAGYKEKLKNLKEQREDLLAKGKILLENAKTDKQRKELDLEIQKELRPLEKEIKELAIEMADVNIRSKSRESLTKTKSPPEVGREKQLKLEQIEAKKRSNSGSGGDAAMEATINKLTGGGAGGQDGVVPPASKLKSMPPDPEAKSVLNELLAVPPEQLLGWADEDIEKAVAMIQQKFPNMHPERIKRLIGIQQNRSK